jgi:hypothetical protein
VETKRQLGAIQPPNSATESAHTRPPNLLPLSKPLHTVGSRGAAMDLGKEVSGGGRAGSPRTVGGRRARRSTGDDVPPSRPEPKALYASREYPRLCRGEAA